MNDAKTIRTNLAIKLHFTLAAVELENVPVMSEDRHIARKEQAKLARELLKRLGVKGVSVTAPNYSMAQSVDVSMPTREDYVILPGTQWDIDPDCEARKANREAREKLELILAIAFPNHDNRSDTQTDYFDYCWSVNG